ncbi:DUF2059 domain-containing protein [Flavicella sediminum]|uniref:DUF2059 domain-containing protein n=1 Tax=Flavicella sediminum TaxID=2585141 RepID=UPI00111DF592|nr:DUF2059 domain-containing protein [Flavicella sediminum]
MKKISMCIVLFFAINLGVEAQSLEKKLEKSTTYINPVYKKTLAEMLEVSGSNANFAMVLNQMMPMLRQQNSKVPKESWREIKKEFHESSMLSLVELLTPVYQKHLSLTEIQGVIAFYKTPLGAKFAKKSTLIGKESMQIGQQWAMGLQGVLKEIIKTKGY